MLSPSQITIHDITYPSSLDPALTALRARIAYPTGGRNLPVLVLMHGWRETAADFDEYAVARFASGQWLDLVHQDGTFIPGETVRGDQSRVTATVVAAAQGGGLARITAGLPSGRFHEGERVSGADSGATAVTRRVITTQTFALFVDMRGRAGSPGDPDGGGREIQDIVDAVDHVLATYPAETNPTQLHIAGYSGGGGNVLLLAARFPELFNGLTSHFGISDYGYDARDGWYFNGANPPQRALLERWIGDPTTHRSRYRARRAVPAVTNGMGFLRMFHDAGDKSTPAAFSQNVAAAFDAAGLSHYALTVTNADDRPRALHGLPNLGSPTTLFEPEWMEAIHDRTHPPCVLPRSGVLQIAGWVDTQSFAVWFGDGTEGTGMVTYDLDAATFDVESQLTGVPVRLTLKVGQAGELITVTVNGTPWSTAADGRGIAHVIDSPR